jgi:hypothetical protein
MSFLNWFSDKPATDSLPPAGDAATSADGSRPKRHARREQLYVVIRDAMTRTGVLSASYKFKVLSLDHCGENFMVMMEFSKGIDGSPGKMALIEGLIIKNARALFEITVPAVYWRLEQVVTDQPATVPAARQGTLHPQLAGFDDVDLPHLRTVPSLSNTQYGDLN